MVHVRTLGASEVLVGEHRITPDSAMLFALALFLSMSAGERVQRSRLLDFFWPDTSDGSQRHALRQLLYRLRRAGFPLSLDGEELLVEENAVESDVQRVLTPGWPDEASPEDVRHAGSFLPGYEPPMPEFFRAWLDDLRARVTTQYRRALLRQIDGARRDGRWRDVDEWARRCLTIDPLNEEATLAHAEAIAMSGSKAKALEIIDEYLTELGDRDRLIGLPAKVLRRRVSENVPERVRGEVESVPLVGREREMGQLVDALEGTLQGHGTAQVMIGPAGIGKSRLAQELIATAAIRGWRPISTGLQVSDEHRPLGVFVDLFGSLLQCSGALGCSPSSLSQLRLLTQHEPRGEADTERSQEAEAVQDRLRSAGVDLIEAVASEGPLLLSIDDIQWCDAASIRLLLHLVARSATLPVMWLIAARHETQRESVRVLMADVRCATIRVGPLTPADSHLLYGALVERAGPDSPAIGCPLPTAVTGGNPLFVLELARHVRETGEVNSLPRSLGALIRDRALRLSSTAQNVLHTCAVIGRYASVSRVASVLEVRTEDLLACIEELDALGIVGTDQHAEALGIHDLWRVELLGSLLPATRKLIHHRCGMVLESESRTNRSPALVWEAAHHLQAGGSDGRALGLLEECAHHQLDNGLPVDAAKTFDFAVSASKSDADRLRAMTGRISALKRAADWTEIARVIGTAIELSSRRTTTSNSHSELELLQIEVQWWTETDPGTSLDRAVSCAMDQTANASHRIGAALLATVIAANLARVTELGALLDIVVRLPRQEIEDRIKALAMSTIYHTEAGDLDWARESAKELVAIERGRGSVRGLARALRFASYPLRCLGEFDAAMDALRESLELAEKHSLIGDAASASDSIVNMCLEQEDISAAQQWVSRAKVWLSQVRARYAQTGPPLNDAMIAIATRNFEEVDRLVDVDVEVHIRNPLVRQRILSLSVIVRLLSHRSDLVPLRAACGALGEALRQAQTIGRVDYVVSSYATGLVALGDSSMAVEYVRRYLHGLRRDRSRPSPQLTAILTGP